MSEMTVLQPEVIEKLRDQLGDEDGVLVREIIQLYLVQARDLLAQLEVAAGTPMSISSADWLIP